MAGFRSARPRIAEPASFASPARAELALAIAARDAHAATAATVDAVFPALDAAADRAWEALQAAKAAMEGARSSAAEKAFAAAIAGEPAPDGGVTAARAALQARDDEYEVAKAALAALPARKNKSDEMTAELVKRVERAAASVLADAPFFNGLASRLDQMQRECAAMMNLLNWARSSRVVQTETYLSAGPGISEHDFLVNNAIERLYRQGRHWIDPVNNVQAIARIGAERWGAAFEALKTDPNAPLPDVVLP